MEINGSWYDIPERLRFSRYEISPTGMLRNKTSKRVFSNKPRSDGYVFWSMIRDDAERISYQAHVLIAETFISNPDNKPTVDHIDRNTTNNNVNNLRWYTMKEQNNNKGEYAKPMAGLPVYQLDLNGNIIKKWDRICDASRSLGMINGSNITECCRGRRNTCKGFKWKYCHDVDINLDEEWRLVPGFDDVYASNFGNIRRDNIPYSHSKTKAGYIRIKIDNTKYFVHQLVCRTFHGEPSNGRYLVNHKNGVKDDNVVNNLEWCSHSENIQHAIDTGLLHSPVPVYKLDMDNNILEKYMSISEAARLHNCTHVAISNACNGRSATSIGYRWRFE